MKKYGVLALLIILTFLLFSCFETTTNARKLESGRISIGFGTYVTYFSGTIDGNTINYPFPFSNYSGFLEYCFTDFLGFSINFNYLYLAFSFGATIILDPLPVESPFHLIASGGILFLPNASELAYNIQLAASFSLGDTLDIYAAVNSILTDFSFSEDTSLYKYEGGMYINVSENFYIRPSISVFPQLTSTFFSSTNSAFVFNLGIQFGFDL